MVFSKHRAELSINLLLEKSEGQYFERKSAAISIPKLVQSIIAFANADGGTIAIGIQDGQIQGINSQGQHQGSALFEKSPHRPGFNRARLGQGAGRRC